MLDKVFIVEIDNCEPYEDGFRFIDKVFSDYNDAIKYVTDTLKMVPCEHSDNQWGKKIPVYEDYEREDFLDEEEWQEYLREKDNPSYTVEEMAIITPYEVH